MAGDYTHWTDERRARFLELLCEGHTVTAALRELNLSRSRAYELRREDAAFAKAWEEAEQAGADVLEDEAFRRAVEGTVQKKFTKSGDPIVDMDTGQQYSERQYSDTLLILLLKARRPEKYRENHKVEVSGEGGGPVQVVRVPAKSSVEEWQKAAQQHGNKTPPQ